MGVAVVLFSVALADVFLNLFEFGQFKFIMVIVWCIGPF
jgi:hypothetical protein